MENKSKCPHNNMYSNVPNFVVVELSIFISKHFNLTLFYPNKNSVHYCFFVLKKNCFIKHYSRKKPFILAKKLASNRIFLHFKFGPATKWRNSLPIAMVSSNISITKNNCASTLFSDFIFPKNQV